jgi:hypothetical protein
VAVPAWMLDPLVCQQLTDEVRPRLTIEALHDLRALLDSQRFVVSLATTTSRAGSPDAGGDETRPDCSRPGQRMLTFDGHAQARTLPDLVQRQCGELLGHLLRAMLQAEASTRSEDDRENRTGHFERAAYVYVRQSSLQQVSHHAQPTTRRRLKHPCYGSANLGVLETASTHRLPRFDTTLVHDDPATEPWMPRITDFS